MTRAKSDWIKIVWKSLDSQPKYLPKRKLKYKLHAQKRWAVSLAWVQTSPTLLLSTDHWSVNRAHAVPKDIDIIICTFPYQCPILYHVSFISGFYNWPLIFSYFLLYFHTYLKFCITKKTKIPYHLFLYLSHFFAYFECTTLPLVFYFFSTIQSIFITFFLFILLFYFFYLMQLTWFLFCTSLFYFFSFLHITFHFSCPFLFYGAPFSSIMDLNNNFIFTTSPDLSFW